MEKRDIPATLTELFRRFPGIGQRQAERFTYFIAQADGGYIRNLTDGITDLHRETKQCPQCFIRHLEPQPICASCTHDGSDVCIVVEKDVDAHTIRRSMNEIPHARYFILGGLIAIANTDAGRTRIPNLIQLLKRKSIKEIVIALSVHPDAEHTMRYISDAVRAEIPAVRITIPGRGLSSGSELEYSDPETLVNAFRRRDVV